MEKGVYMVLKKVKVVQQKEVVVDAKNVPSSQMDQTYCELGN